MAYAELDACIAAGLDVEKWQEGGYSKEIKMQVMAWHRLSSLIRSHSEQAVADKVRKKK